jgi:hypothetical protein
MCIAGVNKRLTGAPVTRSAPDHPSRPINQQIFDSSMNARVSSCQSVDMLLMSYVVISQARKSWCGNIRHSVRCIVPTKWLSLGHIDHCLFGQHRPCSST